MSAALGKNSKSVARTIGLIRIGIGVSALVWPEKIMSGVLKGDSNSESGGTLAIMAGGRDVALGLGTCLSIGSDTPTLRRWIMMGILADASDMYAFWTDDSFGKATRILSGLTATSAVALGAWVVFNLD